MLFRSRRVPPWWPLLAAMVLVAPLVAAAQSLPPEVDAALARARVPRDALAAVVVGVEPRSVPRLSWRADRPMNPASVMKLVTTFAGLELLGPAFTWRTQVFLDGAVRDGTLHGNLYIKGGGDPKLVSERLWLLLRRVRGLGIDKVAGDIVLDHSAFEPVSSDPAAFDNEPLRPYNAAPDALLVNFKSVLMNFVPDPAGKVARIHYEPPLAGVALPPAVALKGGGCGDWRGGLRADFSDPDRIRFAGAYSAACGEKLWGIALPLGERYATSAVAGMWRAIGGTLSGQVRDGRTPAALAPAFEVESPPLADVIRDINKFSNNLMAQQLFLTLSLQDAGTGTVAGSRAALQGWWKSRFDAPPPAVVNGSGLSRDARIEAGALARMLQAAFASPVMPELLASLPISGVDGTLRHSRNGAVGAAHLKSGSLRDVTALAGYVDGASGQRYVLIAIVNDPNANAARAALDALVDWTRIDSARLDAARGAARR